MFGYGGATRGGIGFANPGRVRLGSAATLLANFLILGGSRIAAPAEAVRNLGELPSARLVPAEEIRFPGDTDSNSPAFWRGGQLHVINSLNHPYLSVGRSLRSLGDPVGVRFEGGVSGPRWLESIVSHEDGTLYGYYHYEPSGVCRSVRKTAPEIGAARSRDGGYTWIDLGIIMRAPPGGLECVTDNAYFVGGEGDFSVALDQDRSYLYFFFSSYTRDHATQGIGLARMAWRDRDAPAGKVFKWRDRSWTSPGLGGLISPLYSTRESWHRLGADALWGPSVHWNTHLRRFVMLSTRAIGSAPEWATEGIYVAYAERLEDSLNWSEPVQLLAGGVWYPQVMGLKPGEGTDSTAGGVARFFMGGVSQYWIRFTRPDKPQATPR
jgi:hypothetical protein